MKIINPSTEAVIKEVAEDNATSIQTKYNAAKAAQKKWAKVPVSARVACIAKFKTFNKTLGLFRCMSSFPGQRGIPLPGKSY